MDAVFTIIINDGEKFIVDSDDEIKFANILPDFDVTKTGCEWQECYFELLNSLKEYEYLSLKRHYKDEPLEYRGHTFAYKNERFSDSEPLIIRTRAINTILKKQ